MYSFKTRNYGSSYHSGEQFGDWEENNDTHFDGIYLSKGHGEVGLFPGQVEPKLGDMVHTVIVRYGSGDSFGNSSGNVCYIWSFTDATKAHELAEALQTDYKDKPDFTTKPMMFEDVPISTYEWKGYFEHLESIEVISLLLTKEYY